MSLGKYAASIVVGLTLLLAGCGGDGGTSDMPVPVVPEGLHITGVDDTGVEVDIWTQPFQAPATLRLSATDNDPVTGVSAQSADSELGAFLGGGGPATHSYLIIDLIGDEARGVMCFGGCSLDLSFDASSRKVSIQFPGDYRFHRNLSEASISSEGRVRVTGSLIFDYDPEWLVLRPKRFPETPVTGSIVIDGQPFEVARLVGDELHGGGMYFVAADGGAIGLSLIADGETLQLLYQDAATSRTWRAEVSASSVEHVDGRYRIRLDAQPLDNLGPDGPDQVMLSIDVAVPEADGLIAVTGIAGTNSLYPTSYGLWTTNDVRRYEFAMVDQDGARFWLTVDEQAGDIQFVQLGNGTDVVHACGVSPWPACSGIRLSDDGYTFSFMASGLGGGVQLDGGVMHAGVRIWAGRP